MGGRLMGSMSAARGYECDCCSLRIDSEGISSERDPFDGVGLRVDIDVWLLYGEYRTRSRVIVGIEGEFSTLRWETGGGRRSEGNEYP